jgi:CRP-like cAMP-binding protein
VLFQLGDVVDALYYVERGHVAVSGTSTQGRVAMVDLIGPGELVGEQSLAGAAPSLYRVDVATQAMVWKMSAAWARSALHDSPALGQAFLTALAGSKAATYGRYFDQANSPTEARLAQLLLQLASPGGDGVLQALRPRLSHERLAELVGTTRPRITVFVNRFKRQGYLMEQEGEMVVSPRLRDVATESVAPSGQASRPDRLQELLASMDMMAMSRGAVGVS